jgi:hypothetical protein
LDRRKVLTLGLIAGLGAGLLGVRFLMPRANPGAVTDEVNGLAANWLAERPVPLPQGDRQGPLVSVSKAESQVDFNLLLPAYLPQGSELEGVFVAEDHSHIRIHFSGGLILVEALAAETRPSPRGLEFKTEVNGFPALAVRGDFPQPLCRPA